VDRKDNPFRQWIEKNVEEVTFLVKNSWIYGKVLKKSLKKSKILANQFLRVFLNHIVTPILR